MMVDDDGPQGALLLHRQEAATGEPLEVVADVRCQFCRSITTCRGLPLVAFQWRCSLIGRELWLGLSQPLGSTIMGEMSSVVGALLSGKIERSFQWRRDSKQS